MHVRNDGSFQQSIHFCDTGRQKLWSLMKAKRQGCGNSRCERGFNLFPEPGCETHNRNPPLSYTNGEEVLVPINFGKLAPPKTPKRPTDPLEIFRGLRVTDRAINDLWLAQGDALRTWDKERHVKDTAIVLNTGAGKTLVGLLAAQSLVNETNGHVAYACSSIQLIEQTSAKAAGYGLEVTTYFKNTFDNSLYQQGLAPCITTYQALFNGKSKFVRENLTAIIFDDAHAAEHLIRDHFTLRITRSAFPKLFVQISELYRSYHDRIGKGVGYSETLSRQDSNTSFFVPPFALHEQLSALQLLLVETDLTSNVETLFAWEHLKNHIDLCACFISGTEVSLTPAVIPVNILPYFQSAIRRLYLSATLPASDAFLRTFGRAVERVIAPTTTAGECERLILLPGLNKRCQKEEDLEIAKQIIASHKALILVPSTGRANQWADTVSLQTTDVTSQIENFKAASSPEKLILVARYDGVDLPGDTCRLMVVDGLPSGVGPLERYLWEQLGMAKVLRSTIASRVIQSFGRIFRGMSDHGVLVVVGKPLVDWLLTPLNQNALPEFLKRQLDIGKEISRQAESIQQFVDAAQQALARDEGWLKYYQDNMSNAATAPSRTEDADELKIANAHVNFGHSLWARDYVTAAKQLGPSLDEIFGISAAAWAWTALWLGYAFELMGDLTNARALYRRSHNAAKNIPPFDVQAGAPMHQYSDQVRDVARYLDCESQGFSQLLRRFDAELSALRAPGSTVPQIEEAIRSLGEYLGLNSTRPEKEFGTGPDDLWRVPNGIALCMEVKSDKTSAQSYWKKDVGQMSDHIQWVKDNSDSSKIVPAFVGPVLRAAADANPAPEIEIVELSQFVALADTLRAALADICTKALPLTLQQEVDEVFRARKLIWPDCLTQMKKRKLKKI